MVRNDALCSHGKAVTNVKYRSVCRYFSVNRMFGISSEQSKIAPEKFSRRAESRSKMHIKYDPPYMVGSCKKLRHTRHGN